MGTCPGPLQSCVALSIQSPHQPPSPRPIFKPQVTELIQKGRLTSARYSKQNFKSPEEPLREQKVRLVLELAEESQPFAGTQSAVLPTRLCVVLPGKRERGRRREQGSLWSKATC